MSDTAQLQRIIIALGIVAAFVVLMYSEMGITGGPAYPFSPTPPSFSNPFDTRFRFTLNPVADGVNSPPSVTDTDTIPDCTPTNTAWWGCLVTHDGAISYVTVTSSDN